MAQWDAYQSLSFFDARTNNFATIRGTGKAVKVALEATADREAKIMPYQGYATGPDAPDLTVYSPTETGVILIRRLAPSAQAFAKAFKVGEGDACSYWQEPAVVF
ncbi:hypothetical protein [Erythrobacter sp. NFXS35]|uniref:hypothetical protein n=1 Tax=Erythrobacter sp. NFXS35 TaxID=2818436 RepID=UPI0032DE3641